MRSRSAVDTIKGYYYQFDYSIYRLLNLSNDSDAIVIEGIEDIDISTNDEEVAIQCKYYSKTKYNNSIIAKPIRLMLKHFKDVKDGKKIEINYYLYGYYKEGTEKLESPLTIKALKENFLTYKEKAKKGEEEISIEHKYYQELGLNDNDLKEFMNKLEINIEAMSYEEQVEKIIEGLKNKFNCSSFMAENYYYNNALRIVKELSTRNDIENRKVTKGEFIKSIDNKRLLFNEWYIQLKGKNNVLKAIRKEYFTQQNVSPFERFFLIEVDKSNYNRWELKELIMIISKKWKKISSKEPNPFCPYIYIHNLNSSELIQIKTELMNEGIKFIDGFSFQGAKFSVDEMKKTANSKNNICIKIINDLDYIDMLIANILNKTKEVYQFYITEPFYNTNDNSIKKVDIQVESIKDIKEIV